VISGEPGRPDVSKEIIAEFVSCGKTSKIT
jgi:hypothetical protein